MHRPDLRAQRDTDVRFAADLLGQVVGHALLEGVAAHDERDRVRVVREEHRRLAGRVAGADEVDVETLGPTRLAARRPIVDTLAQQALEALDGEAAPTHPGRDDEGAGPEGFAAVEPHGA